MVEALSGAVLAGGLGLGVLAYIRASGVLEITDAVKETPIIKRILGEQGIPFPDSNYGTQEIDLEGGILRLGIRPLPNGKRPEWVLEKIETALVLAGCKKVD